MRQRRGEQWWSGGHVRCGWNHPSGSSCRPAKVALLFSAGGAGNPSPVREKGRDEGLPLIVRAQRSRRGFYCNRTPLSGAPRHLLPSGRRKRRRASRESLSPRRRPMPILRSLTPTKGAVARRRVAGGVRCSWNRAVAGRTPWRGFVARVDHNPVREGRNGGEGTRRQPRAGRSGGFWRCFDTTLDIDIGTQPSTATPPRPAHPLGYAKTRKPRGFAPDGAFGADGGR